MTHDTRTTPARDRPKTLTDVGTGMANMPSANINCRYLTISRDQQNGKTGTPITVR
jgi:hypothetical protein